MSPDIAQCSLGRGNGPVKKHCYRTFRFIFPITLWHFAVSAFVISHRTCSKCGKLLDFPWKSFSPSSKVLDIRGHSIKDYISCFLCRYIWPVMWQNLVTKSVKQLVALLSIDIKIKSKLFSVFPFLFTVSQITWKGPPICNYAITATHWRTEKHENGLMWSITDFVNFFVNQNSFSSLNHSPQECYIKD